MNFPNSKLGFVQLGSGQNFVKGWNDIAIQVTQNHSLPPINAGTK